MSSSAHYVTIRMLGDAKQLEATLARAGLVAEEESSKIGSAFEKGGEKAGGAFQKLGTAMGNMGLPFSNTVSKFGQDFSKIETRGKKFTSAMSEVGKVSALGFAAGFAAIAVDGIKNFANLQQLMTKLVTTGGESAANIKSDTSGVIGLSSQVDQSTSALAGGLYTINSAGFHGAKGLAVLKPAAQAATAEMADLPTVTNAITSALNAYSLGASSSVPITNQMIAATSRGKMSFQDLAGALPEVLPVAASAKLSFAQVTGALATLTAQGMSAQQGAQDLSNTIRSLQNPNQVAIATMEQLGLNSNDVAKNLGKNGLTGTLSQLSQTILQHMGPSGEVLMGAFKQSQAASGDLQIMLNNMTPSVRNLANEFMSGKMTMTQFRKALPTNEQGIVGQFSTLYNKVHGFSDQLKSGSPAALTYNATLSKITGGATGLTTSLMLSGSHMSTFEGNVAAVGNAAKGGGSNINHWADVQKNFNVQLGNAKLWLEGLILTIGGKLMPIVESAIGVMQKIAHWFGQNKWAAELLGGVIATFLVTAIAIWVGGMITAAAATLAATWPILAVVAGIMILGAGIFWLVKHWKQVWGDIKKIVGEAVNWLKGHWELILAILTGPIGLAVLFIKDHLGQIERFFKSLPTKILNFLKSLPGDLMKWAGDAIGYALVGLLTGAVLLWDFFTKMPGKIIGLISHFGSDFVKWAKDAWHFMESAVSTSAQNNINFFEKLPGRIIGAISRFLQDFPKWMKEAWVAMHNALVTARTDTLNWFKKLPGKIITALGDATKWLLQTGKDIITGLINGIKSMAGDVINAIKSTVTDHLPGFVKKALGIHSPSTVFMEIGKNIGKGLANGILATKSLVTAASNSVLGSVTGISTSSQPFTGVSVAQSPYAAQLMAMQNLNGKQGATASSGVVIDYHPNVVITGTNEQIATQTRKMITDSHQQLVDLIETRIPG